MAGVEGCTMIGTPDTLLLPVFVEGSVAGLVEVFCEWKRGGRDGGLCCSII